PHPSTPHSVPTRRSSDLIGDLVAGTVVVRDRPEERRPGEEHLPEPAELAAPLLSDEEFQLLSAYASRAADLAPAARSRVASGLAGRLAGPLATLSANAPGGLPGDSSTGAADQLLALHTE